MIKALLCFIATYLIIAGQKVPYLRLDRPAGALLGAMGMVLLGVVTPKEATGEAINHDTLLLLSGMMIVACYMIEARMFRFASWFTLTHVASPRLLLLAICLVSGGLSAVLVNDTVCLMVTPLLLQMTRDAKLPPLPYLLALCFSANAGSVATPTGNPQNMIIGTLSGVSYTQFTLSLALPALASLFCVAGILLYRFRSVLPSEPISALHMERPALQPKLAGLCLFVLLVILTGFFLGYPLSWTALFGASLLILFGRRPPRQVLERVDFVLLIFFAGLFVVVYGVGKVGLTQLMWTALSPYLGTSPLSQSLIFGGFTVVASQVVSNVPFVLLASSWMKEFADPKLMWLSMALFSTLAGNLTLVGSMANLIVIEGAKTDNIQVGFWEFFGHGLVVTLATLLVGFSILYGQRMLGLL